MDIYNAGIGLCLLAGGILVFIILYRIGDFDKGAKITRNTIGLIFGGIIGIVAGLYFIITSFE